MAKMQCMKDLPGGKFKSPKEAPVSYTELNEH